MAPDRRAALTAGVLFIVATAASLLSAAVGPRRRRVAKPFINIAVRPWRRRLRRPYRAHRPELDSGA